MLILAGVSINAVVGDNGVLSNAQKATLFSKFAAWKEELALNTVEDTTITCAKENMKNYIQSMEDDYLEKFVIANSELLYIGDDEQEKEVCRNLDINDDVGSSGVASDIITIYDKVLSINSEMTEEFIGEVLYNKDGAHLDNWNLVITYDSLGNELDRYGTGYYLLKAGTYTINGENINLTQDYVINYENKFLKGLGNYKQWNLESTLAFTDGLVLNVDPMNLTTGRWVSDSIEEGVEYFEENGVNTGLKKAGDVVYDNNIKALRFNESDDNPEGSGGYLKLTRTNVDFSNGFTFELYANLKRLRYHIEGDEYAGMGLFCRIPTLESNCFEALRFGHAGVDNILCKFTFNTSYTCNDGMKLNTGAAAVRCSELGYDVNEDVYITFIYVKYSHDESEKYKAENPEEYNSKNGNYDIYMEENQVDKVLYYINGELYGYTYYDPASYTKGLTTWNNDECPFYVGACPFGTKLIYYLKGEVYTCRLYQTSMTPTQVYENMSATKQYRASF